MSDKDRGLYKKYTVLRTETGRTVDQMDEVTDQVFVLNIDTDPIARKVLAQYAVEARHAGHQKLADDIVFMLGYPRKES
jgi:hypothetical protein